MIHKVRVYRAWPPSEDYGIAAYLPPWEATCTVGGKPCSWAWADARWDYTLREAIARVGIA